MSVNGESQKLVVREMTDLMYNTDHLQDDAMIDCWVLVFALDCEQSFGKRNFLFSLNNFSVVIPHKAKQFLYFLI